MEEDEDRLEDRLNSVQYDNWRRNAPFLYDLELIHTLLWPSLTVQWLPGKQLIEDSDYSVQQCIVGTHTSGAAQNFVKIQDIAVPVEDGLQGSAAADDDDSGSPRYSNTYEELQHKVTETLWIPHEGEVNRARYMPLQQQEVPSSYVSYVIATKPPSADVYVFDTKNYTHALADGEEEPSHEGECRPDLRLTGHASEGYGLCWSHLRQGHLLSGSDDSRVCTWDISGTPTDGQALDALAVYSGHSDVVEDVAWHAFNQHIFGSVGDDKQLILWDTRKPPQQGAIKAAVAHSREVYGLAFNPYSPHLLATCSSDTTVALRDWRNLAEPLHVMEAHTDGVQQVSWCPQQPTVLASSSLDKRLMVWDISRIGAKQSPEEADDGPPELLFVHAGQAAKLNDFAWNTNDGWVVASVSDENTLQVWQITEAIRAKVGNPLAAA